MTLKPSRRHALQLIGAGLFTGGTSSSALGEALTSRGRWRAGPSLPMPVQEIYPCAHKGRIHLAGGFVSEAGKITGPTDAHFAFDPATGEWSARAPLPVARHHPQLVSFQGHLYAIGGYESRETGAWQMQGDMWQYDDAADVWGYAPSLPVPNAESVAGVISNRLFLAGGRQPATGRNLDWDDQTDVATLLVFDGTSWQDAAPMPTARNSAAGGVIDGRLHIIGGRTVTGGNLALHEVYDPGTDRWETLAPMPQAQGGLAAAIVNERLYAFGGEYFGRTSGVYPDVWAYDAVTDRWTTCPDMPTPRHGLGAVALGSDIYTLGGARKASGVETSTTVEIFTP